MDHATLKYHLNLASNQLEYLEYLFQNMEQSNHTDDGSDWDDGNVPGIIDIPNFVTKAKAAITTIERFNSHSANRKHKHDEAASSKEAKKTKIEVPAAPPASAAPAKAEVEQGTSKD